MRLIFILLCWTGALLVTVSKLPPFRHKYHVIMTRMTWLQAQNYCRVNYKDLATIESSDDWERLTKEVKRVKLTDRAWVGLYNDIDSWRWSLDDLPLKNITLRNWGLGEPNNVNGDQSCVYINIFGRWIDYACTGTKHVICFDASNTGPDRFVAVPSPLMTWTEAQSYCRTFHTDLASALNQADNDLLHRLASGQGPSWFGLFRDTWKWSDGTIPTNLLWDLGQPNNFYKDEDCGDFFWGALTDRQCSELYYVICHTLLPVKERQVMTLQVKSDGSVLDPAVQSAILEQIKKKLKENGVMENTTVSWRVRPDGQIFHNKKDDL
ncbi:putative C-type lectin domain family 20 member A [Hemibagrus wyckioides]|uniref:putative C-type lectin domain family 20 member A n=1 Tax=Hemibagrus wyckioides TaxID=337641 RepID=UPI00266C91F6|nr:putative C-type lectin domain family 20 member A [Hemibagrus wyckioides]